MSDTKHNDAAEATKIIFDKLMTEIVTATSGKIKFNEQSVSHKVEGENNGDWFTVKVESKFDIGRQDVASKMLTRVRGKLELLRGEFFLSLKVESRFDRSLTQADEHLIYTSNHCDLRIPMKKDTHLAYLKGVANIFTPVSNSYCFLQNWVGELVADSSLLVSKEFISYTKIPLPFPVLDLSFAVLDQGEREAIQFLKNDEQHSVTLIPNELDLMVRNRKHFSLLPKGPYIDLTFGDPTKFSERAVEGGGITKNLYNFIQKQFFVHFDAMKECKVDGTGLTLRECVQSLKDKGFEMMNNYLFKSAQNDGFSFNMVLRNENQQVSELFVFAADPTFVMDSRQTFTPVLQGLDRELDEEEKQKYFGSSYNPYAGVKTW